MKQIIAYIPVLHSGYERLLSRHADADELLLLGSGFGSIFPSLRKEIRALEPAIVALYLRARFEKLDIRVVQPDDMFDSIVGDVVVLPDEEIMRDLVTKWKLATPARRVVFDETFLRWDRKWSLEERPAAFDCTTTSEAFATLTMGLVDLAGKQSSDWWRRVGAAVARDGQLLEIEHNSHLPTEYAPYIDGDPRNEFHRGLRPDLSTAIHAEAKLIARFAREGRPTVGADMFVGAFPCPSCARLIAAAGFRRCYFRGSYAMLDGDRILRDAGVELIWVDTGSGTATAEPHP
jgi:dCMP deaminase